MEEKKIKNILEKIQLYKTGLKAENEAIFKGIIEGLSLAESFILIEFMEEKA
ncbi:hypothetical protein [Clostridium botulinum]|uniref:hypothetical protein n=1 Tax=Clostridium botulinum TaxID=1491 RepID=UPI000AB3F62D|nr:hypothetical protein [Clostridium botulinum]MBY6932929.1 hypothetical protein [Clostridium botulinum]